MTRRLPSHVPEIRVRLGHPGPVDLAGKWVLYWMIAHRRCTWNFSLQRAAEWAQHLQKPLIILEALRCDYRWASDRIHTFVIQGMLDNARSLKNLPVTYYPYLEESPGSGKGLLRELAKGAAVVVSDDFPCFFLPRMVAAAQRQIPVRFELVDSNGLYPMRATDRVFQRAYDFRRHLQKALWPHLEQFPQPDPLANRHLPRTEIPELIRRRWPPADLHRICQQKNWLQSLPIDHQVHPVETPGGSAAADRQLKTFIQHRLAHYAERRNEPEEEVASGLSPYLHFGHISAHRVFAEVTQASGWQRPDSPPKPTGSATGWWGLPAAVESFLDEMITWRELGYNFCSLRSDYDRYESLPDWAQATLAKHAADPRPWCYDVGQFEKAQTHDPLWNAAQQQLVTEGRIHNYLRMLWGKKIVEWSASPRLALEIMIELNNKYALDGRNPNSYSGIFWVLGRYDRPWGPERPIFGQVRYMSSENTARKVSVKNYIRRFAPQTPQASRLFD